MFQIELPADLGQQQVCHNENEGTGVQQVDGEVVVGVGGVVIDPEVPQHWSKHTCGNQEAGSRYGLGITTYKKTKIFFFSSYI